MGDTDLNTSTDHGADVKDFVDADSSKGIEVNVEDAVMEDVVHADNSRREEVNVEDVDMEDVVDAHNSNAEKVNVEDVGMEDVGADNPNGEEVNAEDADVEDNDVLAEMSEESSTEVVGDAAPTGDAGEIEGGEAAGDSEATEEALASEAAETTVKAKSGERRVKWADTDETISPPEGWASAQEEESDSAWEEPEVQSNFPPPPESPTDRTLRAQGLLSGATEKIHRGWKVFTRDLDSGESM
jgi:hypothetical protein